MEVELTTILCTSFLSSICYPIKFRKELPYLFSGEGDWQLVELPCMWTQEESNHRISRVFSAELYQLSYESK